MQFFAPAQKTLYLFHLKSNYHFFQVWDSVYNDFIFYPCWTNLLKNTDSHEIDIKSVVGYIMISNMVR